MHFRFCVFALVVSCGSWASANLITNPGFEDSSVAAGQGIMPVGWFATSGTPDTYSNDGSFGLAPSGFGNFPGVTSHGGNCWIAGWSAIPESFMTSLTSPMSPGTVYTMSGWLHQALRADLDNRGGYDVYFGNGFSASILAGHLGDTVSTGAGWQSYSFSFVPTAAYDSIFFMPTGSSSYPGLDDVSLEAVPEPASIASMGLGLVALLRRRNRKA